MKTSRILVAASCAVLLLNGASAAFAQRGGGGRGGGGGGFHSGMGASRGGARSTMGHRGGRHGPFVQRRGFVGFQRRGFVGPVHSFRQYYAFRPHVSVGFGVWAGYPFAYPRAFHNPYYYPYSYYPYYSNHLYVPHGSVSSDVYERSGAVIDQANMGGLSFDTTPNDAELFVDNVRVGTVGEFTSTTQPLGLAAGHHHVEIRAAGYQTISFDVEIVAGRVLPYQGALER